MPPLSLPYTFLGRAVKPLPFAAMLTMLVIVVINIYNVGTAQDALWGDFIAIVAGAAAVSLAAGWWYQSHRMSEIGLLISASVTFGRTIFILATLGPTAYNWAFTLCWTIALGGAYLLERAESLGDKETVWTRRTRRR